MASDNPSGTEIKVLLEKVKIDIKALLCSSKEGLTQRELMFEYRNLNGENIPYANLGCHSIHDLMKKFSDFVQTRRHYSGQTWVYHAMHDDLTKDLGRLIQGQLDPKRGLREKKRAFETARYTSRSQSYNYRPSSTFYPRNGYFSHPTQRSDQLPPRLVPTEVQKDIEMILKRSVNYRLNLYDLEIGYKKLKGSHLDSKQFGFSCLIDLFESINHLVYLSYTIKNNDKLHQDPRQVYVGLVFTQSPGSVEQDLKSFEEQTIENLKKLIESYGKEGVSLRSISNAYFDTFNKPIDFEKLGYGNLLMLIGNKLSKCVEMIETETNDDFKLVMIDKQSEIENNEDSDQEQEDNIFDNNLIKDLIFSIENAFRQHIDVRLSENEFLSVFESRHGYKLNFLDYGFSNFDQLKSKLHEIGIIRLDFYDGHKPKLYYPSEYIRDKISTSKFKTQYQPILKKTSTNNHKNEKDLIDANSDDENTSQMSLREMQLYSWKKNQAEFIQDYVLYETDLERNELHRKIVENDLHKIIVSNVYNPCNIQIQLAGNESALNKLMDDLEKEYYGAGAGYYDMPVEYVKIGKLCAAVYEPDKNWHRCRIISVNEDTKLVKVTFIDYGGDATVPINSLKFLLKKFNLPIQAMNARFANIKPKAEFQWRKGIVNYMLNRVMRKLLDAHVMGIRNDFISLEIIDKTEFDQNGRPAGSPISLNQRLVFDGFGEFYDEANDDAFIDFDSWKEQFVNSPDEELRKNFNKTPSDVSTRSMLSSNGQAQEPSNIVNKSIKDLNNNDNNESVISKHSYLRIDELTENTVLKQKQTKINIWNSEHVLNFLAIDKKIYLHSSQIANLVGLDWERFEHVYLNLSETNGLFSSDEVYFTKFLNNEQNMPLFDWISAALDLNLEEKKETFLIVNEKLQEFLDIVFTAETSRDIKQAMLNRKSNKNNSINPPKSECSNGLDTKLSNLNLNLNSSSSRIDIDIQIKEIQLEILKNERDCEIIRIKMSKMANGSSEYKELTEQLGSKLEAKNSYSRNLTKLKSFFQ